MHSEKHRGCFCFRSLARPDPRNRLSCTEAPWQLLFSVNVKGHSIFYKTHLT